MSSGRWLGVFLISLGHVILPLVGVFLVTEALYVTDLAGIRGGILLQALPVAAFMSLMPVWIGRRLFPIREGEQGVLVLSEQHRREGRYDCLLIGVVLGVETMIRDVSRYDNWSETASAVVYFPLILVSGLLMLRFARILRAHVDTVRADAKADGAISAQVISLLAKALRAVAIVGMVLVAVGYARGAAALVFPAIYTVFLGGLIGILHRGLIRFLSLLSGDQESVESSLWSVLLAFLLLIAAVPLVLLFWGAGPQYISELIQKIGAGLRVGDVTISPREVLIFIAVFGVGYGLTRLLQSTLRNSVLPRTKLDAGGQNAVVAGVGYVGLTVAAIIAIQNTGIDLGSIALVASALSVGIGFGLQTVVSNFVSGIILLIERPIAEGDWIEVNGQMGYVRDISVRSTRIETFDRTDVIIPNSDLVAGTVTNYTRGNTVGRVIVPVGVAYGTDPRLVEKILLDVANAHPMVLATPAPYVVFQGFGASSLDFEIRAILRDVNWVLSVRSDMNYDIAQRFMEAGIEIPFPQQDIWLRNPEKLNTSHPVQVEPVSVAQNAAMPPDLSDVDAPDGDGGDR
jgi:small-conductance mechanosensitive channel